MSSKHSVAGAFEVPKVNFAALVAHGGRIDHDARDDEIAAGVEGPSKCALLNRRPRVAAGETRDQRRQAENAV